MNRTSVREGIAGFFPGYFALVMATGIIAIASHLLGLQWIAWPLHWIGILSYVVLWVLTIARVALYWPNIVKDMRDYGRGPGFFTLVAGTTIVGSQLVVFHENFMLALAVWFLGLALWLIVMYSFFAGVVVSENKPKLETGINGAWLLATVATQGISVLGSLAAPHLEGAREPMLFFSLCMFLLGAMMYISIITLIFYRFTFLDITTAALTPPYWINMGAVAITTLAGATLVLRSQLWPVLHEMTPFLKGFSLFFWSAGSWWIPLLFILGAWRHVYKKHPLVYDPQYWGMVFPLGMYTACTLQLAKAVDLPFLIFLPDLFIYVALIAWLAAFWGMVKNILLPGSPVAVDPPGKDDK